MPRADDDVAIAVAVDVARVPTAQPKPAPAASLSAVQPAVVAQAAGEPWKRYAGLAVLAVASVVRAPTITSL